jgi:hypothetical protein
MNKTKRKQAISSGVNSHQGDDGMTSNAQETTVI